MKEYIPFIVFASVIALFTIIFIVSRNMASDEDETQENRDSGGENETQEQEN